MDGRTTGLGISLAFILYENSELISQAFYIVIDWSYSMEFTYQSVQEKITCRPYW
jgi:hypothetical protein